MTEKLLHTPVLLEPILEILTAALQNHNDEDLRYFDGTFGRGGHLKALLSKNPGLRSVAFDQDPEAIKFAEDNFKEEIQTDRLKIYHKNFSEFSQDEFGHFDIMLIDLGVSSPQLDEGHRGFSFYHDGPLDMRMNPTTGLTAAEIVNTFSEEDLVDIFKNLGEVQRPNRVVQAIVHDRNEKPFITTRQLASMIERIEGWRKKGFNPATQYFMALRLYVNQELKVIEESLLPLIHGLKPRGRLAVLTFHSLEDRIVKNLFKNQESLGRPLFKKVIQATWAESQKNPRARSAKLRVFEKGPFDDDVDIKKNFKSRRD